METPQEKATRLGVPLLPQVDLPAYLPEKERDREAQSEFLKKMAEHMNEIVCVCACGKEITRKEYVDKKACGLNKCPFGYETNTENN